MSSRIGGAFTAIADNLSKVGSLLNQATGFKFTPSFNADGSGRTDQHLRELLQEHPQQDKPQQEPPKATRPRIVDTEKPKIAQTETETARTETKINILPPATAITVTVKPKKTPVAGASDKPVVKAPDKPVVKAPSSMQLFPGAKTTAELNQQLLVTIGKVNPPPAGLKPHGKYRGGINESESAARLHQTLMKKHDFKAKFESLGQKYNMPPALIAGIASRESNMGTTTKQSGIFIGWGDKGIRKNHGETVSTYHGFGIIQVDKKTAPLGINKILMAAYGKVALDPYSEEHIEWGVQSFFAKLHDVQKDHPKMTYEQQIATAVSKYNGGNGGVYPGNDRGTTGGDYANDVLVRARWFANNWDKIK